MKIILRADVENLGRLGDVVDVRPGYGRNFLIPHGYAMLASASNIKSFELERKKLQTKMDQIRSDAQALAEKLNDYVLTIPMRVGENDKLYGAVAAHTIADLLIAEGFDIDRRRVLLETPIRTLGEHPVRIRLHADVIPTINVNVVAEERGEDVQNRQSENQTSEPVAEENADGIETSA